jgi:hypothetical protein
MLGLKIELMLIAVVLINAGLLIGVAGVGDMPDRIGMAVIVAGMLVWSIDAWKKKLYLLFAMTSVSMVFCMAGVVGGF